MRSVIVWVAAFGVTTIAAFTLLGTVTRPTLADEGGMPDFAGGIAWLN